MNKTEQGVLPSGSFTHLLVHLLLLLTFSFTHNVSAEALPTNIPSPEKNSQKPYVFIVYSPDNPLYSRVAKKLIENLSLKRSDIIITQTPPKQTIKTIEQNNNNIIIGIGHAGIQSVNKHYPETKKLFISTAPNIDRLKTNKDDAILYMTQSYCRQIKFIRRLNNHWKTISILSSEKKPIDNIPIQQCASKYNFKIYQVNTKSGENQSRKIKDALSHSDVLLALPDNSIYNSKTVKNILLTSYRYRKPVIAFSKNFVSAGALASINSDTNQISQSAYRIVEQYFNAGNRFEKPVNFPQAFDININRQVFRALDLSAPNINELKKSLQENIQNTAGEKL